MKRKAEPTARESSVSAVAVLGVRSHKLQNEQAIEQSAPKTLCNLAAGA
ncbi:MAG TPA: hypothetical protein V6C50_12075 [Crinalium sp.]